MRCARPGCLKLFKARGTRIVKGEFPCPHCENRVLKLAATRRKK